MQKKTLKSLISKNGSRRDKFRTIGQDKERKNI